MNAIPFPHVIIVGNEKGGSGKSTTVMHLAVSLLRLGKTVTVIDLDARQGTISRYFENRRLHAEDTGLDLPMPNLLQPHAVGDTASLSELDGMLGEAFADMAGSADVVIVDTPGADTPLSRVAHSYADTLVTPMNDSFIDLDVMAKVNARDMTIAQPSHYAELVWQQRMLRAQRGQKPLDWIVMRNRMGHTDSKNKREIEKLLEQLAKRISFRMVPGFSERVIFRELFHQGLTLMDIAEVEGEQALNMSHLAARQEVRALVEAIRLA
ncbi:MAG: AAA family ATPase [Alphaproteobacteria bacterium]|nr:AAA family ATPase [Alphaproteobacteria bacterium]